MDKKHGGKRSGAGRKKLKETKDIVFTTRCYSNHIKYMLKGFAKELNEGYNKYLQSNTLFIDNSLYEQKELYTSAKNKRLYTITPNYFPKENGGIIQYVPILDYSQKNFYIVETGDVKGQGLRTIKVNKRDLKYKSSKTDIGIFYTSYIEAFQAYIHSHAENIISHVIRLNDIELYKKLFDRLSKDVEDVEDDKYYLTYFLEVIIQLLNHYEYYEITGVHPEDYPQNWETFKKDGRLYLKP